MRHHVIPERLVCEPDVSVSEHGFHGRHAKVFVWGGADGYGFADPDVKHDTPRVGLVALHILLLAHRALAPIANALLVGGRW